MKGLTNAISQSGGGGGGDTISAVNRTNAIIREGDKVWINKDTLASGEHFSAYYRRPTFVFGEISPLGTLAILERKVYEIAADKATEIYETNLNASDGYLIQEGDNLFCQAFISSGGFIRLGANPIWSSALANHRYLGNGLALYYASSDSVIVKIDLETGKVLYQSETININSGANRIAFINNIFIITRSKVRQAWLVNDTGSSIELTPQNPTNTLTSDLYTKGLFTTNDNKYILATSSNSGKFKIISYNNNTFIEYDMASDFPELMEWANNNKLHYSFDRDSGLLTFASGNSNSYAVFKYENGKFNKQIIELPSDVSITNFECQIGITRDMTRISFINKYAYPDCYLNIASLTNDERYLLQSNAYYNIGETTLTGKANQDIPSGGTGEVTTILAD